MFVEKYTHIPILKYKNNNLELSHSSWNLKAFSKTLSKSSAVLVLSVVFMSGTIAYQTPPSYAASVSLLDIESLFEQYEKNLITPNEFADKLEQLRWDDHTIRKALTLHQDWTDTDSLGHHAASPMVKGVELLTLNEPKIEFVSEQKEYVPVKQVEKEYVNYDEGETKSSQELVMSQEKPSSAASSDSIKDMMYGMIIAGVVLVAGLIIAAVKKEII